MPHDKITRSALLLGRKQATEVLARRGKILRKRERVLKAHAPQSPVRLAAAAAPAAAPSRGVLVAEGDSWFDYPLVDILGLLDDEHGFDVESVAHRGDAIEEMAYGGTQLEDFVRRLEKVRRRGHVPKAILLSGGGNDVAGPEFGMLLNHAASAIAGWNARVLDGVIDDRVRTAYVTILSRVTTVCLKLFGRSLPILVHGYDYPVPDGRGFLGGWWLLPGPWLQPGFREKGFGDVARRVALAGTLIDRFNAMLAGVAALPEMEHVSYIDLRGTLPTGPGYKTWWANELHPTHKGFRSVTARFVTVLDGLP
jgi:hypothetical protein